MLIFIIFVTIPKIFHPRNFHSVIAHALHNVENKNVLKDSKSYKNGSLSLSAPYQERRHRSLTIAIRPSSVLTEGSKEVKKAEAQPKKRGTYLTVAAEEKARVAT